MRRRRNWTMATSTPMVPTTKARHGTTRQGGWNLRVPVAVTRIARQDWR